MNNLNILYKGTIVIITLATAVITIIAIITRGITIIITRADRTVIMEVIFTI